MKSLQADLEQGKHGPLNPNQLHLMNGDLAKAVAEGEILRMDALSKTFWHADLIRRTA